MSTIALVIPYYNRRALLERTLESIALAKEQPTQILLVDNASTDGSASVCRQWAQEHPLLKVELLEESMPGASAARNRGLAAVESEWVFFFDSDDELDADFFADIRPMLNDDWDMLAVPTRMFLKNRSQIRKYKVSSDPVAQIFYSHLNTQGMIFRTSFLRKIGGWNIHALVWNDWELGLRALLHRPRFRWISERPYHRIHVHDDSITGNSYAQKGEERLQTLRIAAHTCMGGKRLLAAIYLRHAMLEGRFMAESAFALALKCRKQAEELSLKANFLLRFKMRLIRWLTSNNIPGIWLLAYWLV